MQTRAQRLAAAMPQGFEAALIVTGANRFYFLDYDTGDAGVLAIFPDESVFFIDPRYIEEAGRSVTAARVVEEDGGRALAELLRVRGVRRLYIEDAASLAFAARLRAALPGVEVDGGPTLGAAVGRLRAVKDPQELARIERAQQLTDECFTYICGKIRPGMREIDLALEMEAYLRSHGASGLAFPTIFISGAKTSLPHGTPGEKKLEDGDFITMDFGAKWQGYCTDMTRTVGLGSVSAEMERVYDTVLRAQLACCEQIRPGLRGSEVDAIARQIIDGAGYAGRFGHGLGHSLGVEIHEEPRCSARCDTLLEPGMLMTIEPGIYLPGRFGVRIEDTVVLTEGGCRVLGRTGKDLILL